jgi:hypothetical protein
MMRSLRPSEASSRWCDAQTKAAALRKVLLHADLAKNALDEVTESIWLPRLLAWLDLLTGGFIISVVKHWFIGSTIEKLGTARFHLRKAFPELADHSGSIHNALSIDPMDQAMDIGWDWIGSEWDTARGVSCAVSHLAELKDDLQARIDKFAAALSSQTYKMQEAEAEMTQL